MSDCHNISVALRESDAGTTGRVPQCAQCGCVGQGVLVQTVLQHILPQFLEEVGEQPYQFCPNPNCTTVYHGGSGRWFTVADLRELVTVKTSDSERPLCYCFGIHEGHLRDEIAANGNSLVLQRISRLIKARMCACEIRNPSGDCCLGQVAQAVKRISGELQGAPEVPAPSDCMADRTHVLAVSGDVGKENSE